MSSNDTTMVEHGNIVMPAKLGIGGLGAGVTFGSIPFALVLIGCIVRGWWLAAGIITVLGIAAAVVTVATVKEGRNWYRREANRMAFRRAERRGDTLLVAGPAGRTPDGAFRLPGLLSASKLSEHTDSYGNPFGLIWVPSAKHYTVVIECFPDGDSLVDQDRVNRQVAHWGGWLAQLGVEDAVVGASVTVDSAPDSGLRLRRMVAENVSPHGSDFSTAVVGGLADKISGGAPQLSTRLALTFSGAGIDSSGPDRGVQEMADEIGNRLPVLLASLGMTGAGNAVQACTAQDIVDFTRVAYDPTVAARVEQARQEGGTGLTWEEAGPAFAEAKYDRYYHDRGVSKSWTMYEGPRSKFYATALRRAFEPTKGVLRKRVTLLYRPIPAGDAPDVIEAEINNAQFNSSTKQRATARQKNRIRFANKAAEEEAAGAGLTRFGMIITTTCRTSDEFPRLEKVIPSLTNQARLKIREALGNEDVAFLAGLPLGVVLPEHMTLPDQIRDWL
jgi:hypothetical protein